MIRPSHFDDATWTEALEWYRTRPKAVQEAMDRLPPWNTYRLKETGQTGRLYSYEEHSDGSVTVKFDTDATWPMVVGHRVSGVPLDQLELVEPSRAH